MSALKPLPLPPRPSRADRTWLPAALSALLATGLAVLIVLPNAEPLPEGGFVAPLRLPRLEPGVPLTDPVIVQRTLFSPTRRNDTGAKTVDGSTVIIAPLGGARVAGVTLSPGRSRVFMVAPSGKLSTLGPGSLYEGWQVAAVSTASVVFVRNGERLNVAVGGVAVRPGRSSLIDQNAEEETPS